MVRYNTNMVFTGYSLNETAYNRDLYLSMNSKVQVSVVIPVKNRERHLELCLTKLLNQTASCKQYEIIVVDDGSSDESVLIAKGFDTRIILAQGVGAGAARNLGIKQATGDIIVFLDSDILVDSSFIQTQIIYHTLCNNLVILGSICSLESHQVDGPCPRRDSREAVLEQYSYNLRNLSAPWSICYTGNLSVRKSTIQKALFDEAFRGWGLEDIEFGYQLAQQGVNWVYSRELKGHHLYYKERNLGSSKFTSWLRNLSYFTRKYDDPMVQKFKYFTDVFNPATKSISDYMSTYKRFNGPIKLRKVVEILRFTKNDINQNILILQEYLSRNKGRLITIVVLVPLSFQYEVVFPVVFSESHLWLFTESDWITAESIFMSHFQQSDFHITEKSL